MMMNDVSTTTMHLIPLDQEERAALDRRAAAFYNYPRNKRRQRPTSVQPHSHPHDHHAWNVIEACAALVSDPLTPPRQESQFKTTTTTSLSPCSSATALGDLGVVTSSATTATNNSKAIWRQDFVQWAFDTLHTLLLSSSQDQDDGDDVMWRIQVVVETCMAVLDKYSSLLTQDNDDDETTWALQGLTCLWMACKTRGTMNANVTCIDTWLHVGRYVYSLEQMVATEQDILSTLDWHVVPPVFADYGIMIPSTIIGQSPLMMMMHPLPPIELEDEPPEVVQAQ